MSPSRIPLLMLRAALVGIAALVTYFWMVRLGDDLGWDESLNFKTYARNPLTAIALYHEPNNHPLESFVKSIFYGVLGWDSPPLYRFTGFIFVVAYLVLAWAWFRELSRRGSLVAASLLVVLMLSSSALNWQATALRGYFLSILLEFFYLLVLVRKSGLLDRGAATVEGREPWSGRVAVRYALLSALILFAVPSNVIVMPALWLLTAAAYSGPGERFAPTLARRGTRLALTSGLFAAVLYIPILLGILAGISRFHGVPAEDVPKVFRAAGEELWFTLEHIAPRGWRADFVGLGLLAIVLAAVLRARSSLTWLALGTIVTCLLPRIAVAAFVGFPSRTKSSFVPPLVFAVVVLVDAVTRRWSARAQALAALVLVGASYACLPKLVRQTPFYRTPSQVAEFLVTALRPSENLVVVAHDGRQELLLHLRRAFGRDRILESYADLKARFEHDAGGDEDRAGSPRRRLRDLVLGADTVAPLDPANVDVLVLIDSTVTAKGESSTWSHPVLDTLKARLPRTSVFSLEGYRMTVFEAP